MCCHAETPTGPPFDLETFAMVKVHNHISYLWPKRYGQYVQRSVSNLEGPSAIARKQVMVLTLRLQAEVVIRAVTREIVRSMPVVPRMIAKEEAAQTVAFRPGQSTTHHL